VLLPRIRDILGADTCAVLLLEETGKELLARAAVGIEEEVEQGVRVPVGRGFAGRIAALGRPVILEDVDHADVMNPILREKGIKSMLGVPLLVGGGPIGVLHVGMLVHRQFTADDVELLLLVADRVAVAIERARLHEDTVRLDQLKANFVAIASHELRTPITTIMGFTATLLDLWERIDDAERRDYLHLVDRDARRLGQLVEDLLLLSSVEAADFRVSRERVPIASLLEKVVADMGADAANVDVVLADDDLAVHADPRHVRQAVGNLLANSLKHGAPPIAIRAQCTADYRVRIHVEDHGAGVPEEFRDRLFTRFSRARASEALPGSGLGLFIVQRLVEVQGGRAWLEDVEPSGARFVVELPASAPRTP
jgi:signal transduction histidine kinase